MSAVLFEAHLRAHLEVLPEIDGFVIGEWLCTLSHGELEELIERAAKARGQNRTDFKWKSFGAWMLASEPRSHSSQNQAFGFSRNGYPSQALVAFRRSISVMGCCGDS